MKRVFKYPHLHDERIKINRLKKQMNNIYDSILSFQEVLKSTNHSEKEANISFSRIHPKSKIDDSTGMPNKDI